jgi:hypothetical protein
MPQTTGASKLNQLGLDDGEYKRLVTWTVDIAVELLPGAQVRHTDSETRIGRKGSLVVYDDGHWHSFEADEGGRDVRSLIEFLEPGIEPVELRRFVLEWLRTHPGAGGVVGVDRSDAASAERDVQHAALVRQVLDDMVPISGTLAENYLNGRGISADWPSNLVGFVTDDERPGEGAIVAVIADTHGIPAGIQLGHLDVLGRKTEVGGTERHQYFIDRKAPGMRFHLFPAAVDHAAPLFVCEGIENALSLVMAFPAAEIIGLPGIGRMRHLPPLVGRDVLVFRDGDAQSRNRASSP